MTHDSQAFKRAARRVPVSARRYATENAEQIVRDRDEADLSWDQVAVALYRMRAIDKPVKGAVLAHYVRDALVAAGVETTPRGERTPRSERASRQTRFNRRDGHPIRREATPPAAPAPEQRPFNGAAVPERVAAVEAIVELAKPRSVRTHEKLRQEVSQGKVSPLPEKPATGASGANPLHAMAEDGTRLGGGKGNGRTTFVRLNSAAEAEQAYEGGLVAVSAGPAPAPAADYGEGAAPAAVEPVRESEPVQTEAFATQPVAEVVREPEARPAPEADKPAKPKVRIPNLM